MGRQGFLPRLPHVADGGPGFRRGEVCGGGVEQGGNFLLLGHERGFVGGRVRQQPVPQLFVGIQRRAQRPGPFCLKEQPAVGGLDVANHAPDTHDGHRRAHQERDEHQDERPGPFTPQAPRPGRPRERCPGHGPAIPTLHIHMLLSYGSGSQRVPVPTPELARPRVR